MPMLISAFRTRLVAGRSTTLRLCRRSSPDPDLHPHLHLHLHLKRHLQLQLHLHLGARFSAPLPGEKRYSSKRSSESRQICDQVSIVSRRASNSFFVRNVRPVIIASRFSTFGSANLKTCTIPR